MERPGWLWRERRYVLATLLFVVAWIGFTGSLGLSAPVRLGVRLLGIVVFALLLAPYVSDSPYRERDG